MSHEGRMRRGKIYFDNGNQKHSEAIYYKENRIAPKEDKVSEIEQKEPQKPNNNLFKKGSKK